MTNLNYTKLETITTALESSTFKRYVEIFEDLKSHHKITDNLSFKMINTKKSKHDIYAQYNGTENYIGIYIALCFNPLPKDDMMYALLGHEFGHYYYRNDSNNEFLADQHSINLLLILHKDIYAMYKLMLYTQNTLSQLNIEPSNLFKARLKKCKEFTDQIQLLVKYV